MTGYFAPLRPEPWWRRFAGRMLGRWWWRRWQQLGCIDAEDLDDDSGSDVG